MTMLFHVILHWNNGHFKEKHFRIRWDTRSSPLLVRSHLAVLMLIWWGLFMSHYILLRSMHLNISPDSKCFYVYSQGRPLIKVYFFLIVMSSPLSTLNIFPSSCPSTLLSLLDVLIFPRTFFHTTTHTYIPFHHVNIKLPSTDPLHKEWVLPEAGKSDRYSYYDRNSVFQRMYFFKEFIFVLLGRQFSLHACLIWPGLNKSALKSKTRNVYFQNNFFVWISTILEALLKFFACF